jgi:phage terminase large subunit
MLNALHELINPRYLDENKSEYQINLPNGSQILFVGADDPQKLKSIEGVTDYWMEEATEFDEDDFDTIDAGLSADVDPPPSITMTFNPIPNIPGSQHWIQRRYLNIEHELSKLAIKGDTAVLRTYYGDNAFCPEETVRVLERYKKTNPSLYKMWGLGLFTVLEGVILDGNWDIVKEVPEGIPLKGYGMDFGFADDPAAVVKAWVHNDEVWLQEVVYASGLTNPELSAVMVEQGVRKRKDEIIADSAEPKSIKDLRNMGWFVLPCKKSRDYKTAAAQFLRSIKIHILEGSYNMIKEFSTWAWKRDQQGNKLPIPADGNDHLVDATIYRIYRHAARWGIA